MSCDMDTIKTQEAQAILFASVFFFFCFQFDPEENDEKNMLLIWDFEVHKVLSQTANSQPPKVLEETLPVAPFLELERLSVKCNCASFPEMNGIFFGQACVKKARMKVRFVILYGKWASTVESLLTDTPLKRTLRQCLHWV